MLQVKAIMRSEGHYQEPNIEGATEKGSRSLFGLSSFNSTGPVKVAVSYISPPDRKRSLVELMGGLAIGIQENCELKKIKGLNESENNGETIRVKVTATHGFNRSTARVIQGDIDSIKAGDLFQMDKWVVEREARMKVRIPASTYSHPQLKRIAHNISKALTSQSSPTFQRIQWLDDPTSQLPTHIISWDRSQWNLHIPAQGFGTIKELGPNLQANSLLKLIHKTNPTPDSPPRVFLQLPLSSRMHRALHEDMKDYRLSIEEAAPKETPHYILVGRYTPRGIQYSWVRPNIEQKQGKESSLPISTRWWTVQSENIGFQRAAEKLSDNIMQLVKVRAWLQLESPDNNENFPFELALKNSETGSTTQTGPVLDGDKYGLVLRAKSSDLKSRTDIERRYVYVFSIDRFGKGSLLFPNRIMRNTENFFPAEQNPAIKKEIILGRKALFAIGEPYGIDTFILLSTTEPISNPSVLDFDGIRQKKPTGHLTPLEELLYDLSTVSRNSERQAMPLNWSIQRLYVLSKEKNKIIRRKP